MLKNIFKYASLALALSLINIQPSFAQNSGSHVPGRLLVQPNPGLSETEFHKILNKHGAKVVSKLDRINVHIIQLPPNISENAIAGLLKNNPHIKFAELDRRIPHTTTLVNDPLLPSEWHIAKINAPNAWDSSTGSNVTVAVLDSGVDATHPDLVNNLLMGSSWNFYDNNSNLTDVTGHGTKVAGTIAAIANNGVGVAGVSPDAKIIPIRISDSTGWATYSNMASGFIWAADHGARVANLSYDGSDSLTVQSGAQYLRDRGGIAVLSAGNNGLEQAYAPSTSVLVVAATDNNDYKASWSNFGNYIDISAPGVGIYTTTNGGGYAAVSGTSFSSPITAAVIALMMSANSSLDPATLEKVLFSTATDLGAVGWDKTFGYGRVNAEAAVNAAKTATPTDTTPPKVAISSPTSGSTVNGIIAIKASATDNVSVARVDLNINGTKIASSNLAPFNFSWDTTTVPDGTANISVVAVDSNNNSATASMNVKVANTTATGADTITPSVSISSPTNGQSFAANSTISVNSTAKDNVGVTSSKLYIDNVLKAKSSNGTISYSWNTRKVALGVHTIKVDSTDAAGNTGTSSITISLGTVAAAEVSTTTTTTTTITNPTTANTSSGTSLKSMSFFK